ncbi:hypothetical protein AA313_de0202241 [Arthrobotrys entomopaga]|nr:hypothetical protein AA313_de0202241 [Arthrobotrys entomopaga]
MSFHPSRIKSKIRILHELQGDQAANGRTSHRSSIKVVISTRSINARLLATLRSIYTKYIQRPTHRLFLFVVLSIETPGPCIVTQGPKFENLALLSLMSVAPTLKIGSCVA